MKTPKQWWQFWKKQEPKQGRKLVVPAERVESIFELIDEFYSAPVNKDKAAKYRLWKAIYEIFPEAAKGGNWRITCSNSTTIAIEEIVE